MNINLYGDFQICVRVPLPLPDILFFIAHNAKTSADKLSSDLKANLNGHTSVI